jgi:lipopolysaccharide heptosyltransferase II
VLRLLKRHLPDAEIFWWVDAALAPLLEGDPDLAGVVRFEKKRWAWPIYWPEMWRSVRWMRAQNFDWVIDLQGLARSGIFAWFANGKLLIGLDDPREGARGFYDIIVPRASFHTHAVDWYLAVLPRLGVPVHWDFDWLPERPDVAAAVKAKWQTNGERWIVLQPGARWPNKRWPIEHFIQLLRQLAAEFTDARFVVLGGDDEKRLGRWLTRAVPARCLDLTGQTSLSELIEWVRLCELMVTNDTGPMHVAAALRKPVIAMFGPTEPHRTGPYGQIEHVLQHPLPCVPCLKSFCAYRQPFECLKAISPATVFDRVQRRLTLPTH